MNKLHFYKVYKNTVPYITTKKEKFDSEIAESLGFSVLTKKNTPEQYFRIAPKTEIFWFRLRTKLFKLGYKAIIHNVDFNKAEELGWEVFSGFEFGLKVNEKAERIAKKVLCKKRHRHLAGINVGYFFLNKEAPYDEETKKMDFAYASIANKTLERFGQFDFVIYFYEDAWMALSREERIVLVDHELEHCQIAGTPYIRDHDIQIQEFKSIAKEYGLKKPEYHWASGAIRKVLEAREEE
jgi:hypothetical protein